MAPLRLCSYSIAATLFGLTILHSSAEVIEPEVLDKRLRIELVATEPEIRTPTAIACDQQGRVFVLENNTHFRPKTYDAPATDRVMLLEKFGADGRAGKITPWAEGFKDGMGLLSLPDGGIVVATRSEVFALRDVDNDGRAEQRTTLLKMDSKAEYPHNGLSGLAQGPDGKIYLGLGENLGAAWVLTGTDGQELRGSDEGAIFRFNADGSGLEWWALGLWNPFGLAFREDGELFALDNDPSGGSLCRLLHIVRGGDYGYRYRYGRTIDHPFVSWFGQIPGTLPPVAIVGEAPCGMLSYRAGAKDGWPAEYAGELIGTTWSEHGLQRFPLTKKGVSFGSQPQWLVRGGKDFRPSGVAQAPDGTVYVSDWVDGSYEVHGRGRVWRIKATGEAGATSPPVQTQAAKEEAGDAYAHLSSSDPFALHYAILRAAEAGDLAKLASLATSEKPAQRLGALLALRRTRSATARDLLPSWLQDPDGSVRRAALQWISEEGLKDLVPKLDAALTGVPSRATFQAYLAATQMLTSGKPDPKATVAQTIAVARDPKRPVELRALALRLVPVEAPELNLESLRSFLAENAPALQVEAIRILAGRRDEVSQGELRRVASAAGSSPGVKAEAAAGLALSAANPETAKVLQTLDSAGDAAVAREARRSAGTHFASLATAEKGDPLTGTGDAAAGRRIFYHPNGPRCFSCHTIEGRGIAIGPDLTQMGRFTPAQVLEAIREPSKEIAPAYAQFHVKKKDGTEAMGIDLFEDNKSSVTLVDATGARTKHSVKDIVSREVLPISMMPPALDATLTTQELRDLIAFLREPRE